MKFYLVSAKGLERMRVTGNPTSCPICGREPKVGDIVKRQSRRGSHGHSYTKWYCSEHVYAAPREEKCAEIS